MVDAVQLGPRLVTIYLVLNLLVIKSGYTPRITTKI